MTLTAFRNFYFAIGLALMWGSTMAELNKGRQLFEAGDYKQALAELTAADTVALPEAQILIGRIYYFGNKDVPINYLQAEVWFHKAAAHGLAEAQLQLGLMYINGQGVVIAKDELQAMAWFRKAAEQGNSWAQHSLGFLYGNGKGVAKDEAQAVSWYRKAAEQGNLWAQHNLGYLYAIGQGVAKDQTLAANWYRKAAEQGNALAQNKLGFSYAQGQGVSKDEAMAVTWYRKGAEQGNDDAQNNLGTMHHHGRGGLLQDHEAAAKWYSLAARQGNAWAQSNLYVMHRDDQLPQADLVQALAWINLAASQAEPHPGAAQERQKLSAKLTPAQVAEAQRLAREWKVGDLLGRSRLKPVSPGLAASSEPATAPITSANDPYPPRPQAQAGVTTCRTKCNNGDCYRTYADGRKKHFQAPQKWNSLNNRFEFDAGTC